MRGLLLTAQLLAQTPALCCCTSHLSQSLHLIVSLPFNLRLFVPLFAFPSLFSTYLLRLSFSLFPFCLSPSLFLFQGFTLLLTSNITSHFLSNIHWWTQSRRFLALIISYRLIKGRPAQCHITTEIYKDGRITAEGEMIARFIKWAERESSLNLCLFFL